jgi:hypothetical protein
VNDLRTEHAEREAHVWADFERLLATIPRDRWETPGVLPDWTVKEMLWHVAGWLDECAGHLERIEAGTLEDPDEGEDDTDERNAGFAEAARAMELDAVWQGLGAARSRVLARWNAMTAITDRAVEEFASETYQHYKEHVPELEHAATP